MTAKLSTQITKSDVTPECGYAYEQHFMTLLVNGKPYGGQRVYDGDSYRNTEWWICHQMYARLGNFPQESAEFGVTAEQLRNALDSRMYEIYPWD